MELEDIEDVAGSVLADPRALQSLREQMLRFATLQLGDEPLAEDAVQEALIGALKNVSAFRGQAALKTWVFAILKNKIADTLRQKKRLGEASALMRERDGEEDLDELFNARGMWEPDERPAAWGNPQESLHQAQFWKVFELCLDGLPGHQARVFMMREYIGLESDEICSTVGISTSNLNVLMHRARLRLRECLENHWYMKKKEQPC
ncbi:RNA polymerase factor sigma-70 [Acidovorax sp. BL-A-41-H1]|uniref:RNA polymerase factor sigma-70 n=1 Tax=Acidovorax sp. BL-A-41-H1 TaxID=3421102 RepID=UPI003F79220E